MPWLSAGFREAVKSGSLGIALTGAGSWLGNAFLAALIEEDALPAPERLRLFARSRRSISLNGRVHTVEQLANANALSGGSWLLLHLAFLGKERTSDLSTTEFLAGNDAILADVKRIAHGADHLRVIFASSGAVYNAENESSIDDPAMAYGRCKITQERQLTAWCADRATPLVIPRIFNIGGPFINKLPSYALSSFINTARRTGRIEIAARRPTFRSYVHVGELLGLVSNLALAQQHGPPLIFDTAGRDVVEMQDLAVAVRHALGQPEMVIERAAPTDQAPDRYVGDGQRYRALMAAQVRDITSLQHIVKDTADFLAKAA